MKSRLFSLAIYLTATISGMMVLLYPFFLPVVSRQEGFGTLRTGEMPVMMTFLLGLCLVALLFEAQGQMVNTKLIALLGILVAINSALRFIETAIPGPGGFTPIFFLIILVGYVFGGRVGFLMGALTLLVSALGDGGCGTMVACPNVHRRLGGDEYHPPSPVGESDISKRKPRINICQ